MSPPDQASEASARGGAPTYGSTRIALHWISAALVVSLAAVGFLMSDADPESALRLWLSRAHAVLGVTTGVVLLARLAARVRAPALAPLPMSPTRRWVMRAVHAGIYLTLFAALASGVGTSIAGDWPGYLLGSTPAAPDLHALAPREGHELFAFVLLGLIGAHVVGVLLHESRHGGALRRMLPARPGARAEDHATR